MDRHRWVELRQDGRLFGKFCPTKNIIELSSKGRIIQFDLSKIDGRQERENVLSLNQQCCDELAARR